MTRRDVGRRLGLAGLTGALLIPALTPITSHADTTPSGLAKASSLSLSLSPQALAVLALPPQLQTALKALPCGVGTVAQSALTQTTSLALDNASNDGTLNSAANDLVSGEATSEAVNIGLNGIDQVVGAVNQILQGDLSCLTGSQTSLPVNVSSLLNTLEGQLSNVTGTLNSTGLGSLDINKTLHVSLDQVPQASDVLNLTTPLSNVDLGPFDAVAVSQAGAQKYSIPTGPQLEAHNTTTNLAIGNSIPLGSVTNISGTITSLLSTIQSDLTSVTSSLTSLSGGSTPTQVVSTVCSTVSTLIPQVNCAQLPISTDPSQAVSSLTTQLTSLQSTLQNLLTGLPSLQNLLGQLPSSLNLADLVSTAGDTSSVLTQPQHNGVHSIATTSFADLKVLQLLSNALPGLPNAPLIELKGISSSAEALVNGTDATPPSGTVSFGELDVLGHAIPLQGLGTSQTVTIPTPLGDLSVVVAIGQPQTINNTPQRKTIQASALHVQIINGDGNGNNPITALGVQSDPTVVDLAVAGTQVDDSMTAVQTTSATVVNPTPKETGMVGPFGFAAVGLLALTSAGLRLAARRRRAADSADLSVD